ncbi:MAG TPA: ABC transporter ATP-binding protein [Solirubrobacteraceae bacterium]|nr:ABC transporter ATP-binding protein [Solirubrobacteraceae bacterium]
MGDQSTQSSAETLEFRDATKRYPGSAKAAVENLSLEVPAGEICVLVGPSGCGKTTAMRMVNRMIDMTSGDILLGGRSVKQRKPSELRRDIGYVIQQVGLFPHRSIADNIGTVPGLLGWDKARIGARVDELMELVGLDDELRNRYPAQLSGGQQQRVGVARALAADPSVMLMDEPFGAIDPINRDRLQDEFLRLQALVRKTIVFVTHDIDEAIKMGDRIAILREGGHLAQYGTPADILANPADEFVARFVGADRGLKRLSLTTLGELELPQPNGHRPVLRLPDTMSARDALSALLTDGGDGALVLQQDGEVHGIATIAVLGGLLSEGRPPAPAPAPAPATADPEDEA